MVVKSKLPKWATLDRRTYLVALFTRCGGFCIFGHKNCLIPHHHYELFIDDLIAEWKASDREESLALWKAEQRAFHSLGEKNYPLRGQFSAISQAIYADHQPLYYIQDLGVSGLTFKPFAKVRIASSYLRLYVELRVDLGEALKGISKARYRKAIRYGKRLPTLAEQNVARVVGEAVKDYLAH